MCTIYSSQHDLTTCPTTDNVPREINNKTIKMATFSFETKVPLEWYVQRGYDYDGVFELLWAQHIFSLFLGGPFFSRLAGLNHAKWVVYIHYLTHNVRSDSSEWIITPTRMYRLWTSALPLPVAHSFRHVTDQLVCLCDSIMIKFPESFKLYFCCRVPSQGLFFSSPIESVSHIVLYVVHRRKVVLAYNKTEPILSLMD